MNDWSEFKTAMIVAKFGSISAAASALNVHRATVSRHIDVVESSLGTVLFVRHPRGVELTEAGTEMLAATQKVQRIFDELKGQARNSQGKQTGELIVTSLIGLLPLVMPAVACFRTKFPDVSIKVLSGEETLRLEYGEAHVALRAGPKPTNPDYVVREFPAVEFGAFIHRNALFRLESSTTEFEAWRDLPFIGPTNPDLHLPFARWIKDHLPGAEISLQVDAQDAVLPAVLSGIGVGFLPRHIARQFKQLVDLDPLADERAIPLWLITHRDLNKTPKVAEFIRLLLDEERRMSAIALQ
ncbi:MAG: LysR family transcriptional regulator [Pseudomonadota bacterium]